MLDEEIATAMRQLEKIPVSRDEVRTDDGESRRAMEAAVQRCSLGQSVFSTAIELSVPILDLILNLKSKGIEARIR